MKSKSIEFISFSACAMALTALGIDIMLPALAELREHFGLPSESTATAQVVTFFLMGQVAQLAFGILSDRFGRLPILRTGFPLYIISGIAAAFAPSLELLLIARFIAGMGASAVLTATIAGVRDRFVGDEMARIMSLVFTIFLFIPVVAPFLGIAILSFSDWKMVFLTPPLFAVIVFLWSFRLQESLAKESRRVLNVSAIGQSLGIVFRNRAFLRYTAMATVLFAGLSSYVASSERIIGEIYGRPDLFPWIFGAIGLLMSVFSLGNSRLSSRFGARKALRGLVIVYAIISSLVFIYAVVAGALPAMLPFFIGLGLLLSLNLAIEPNTSALALEPLGDVAGMAAALYGTCFFFMGSALSTIINMLLVESVLPLATSFFFIGIVSLILVWSNNRKERKRTNAETTPPFRAGESTFYQ